MTIRQTPKIDAARPAGVKAYDPDPVLMEKWDSGLRAATSDNNVISILDVIGEDFWTGEGVTAKRVSAALRSIKADEILVDINSPGGDYFEGVAIYNALRQDSRKVTVRIIGLAASAASVIAMAGDEVQIGQAGFVMVHNAWVVGVGNRHDLRAAADTMEPFDDAMAAVYAAKAGVEKETAAEWMDGETWFNGEQAVSTGLADTFLDADIERGAAPSASMNALRRIDSLLAKQDIPRGERRALLAEVKGGKQDAALTATQNASDEWVELSALLDTLKI